MYRVELYFGIHVTLIEADLVEYARWELYKHMYIRNGKNRLIVQHGNENVPFNLYHVVQS